MFHLLLRLFIYGLVKTVVNLSLVAILCLFFILENVRVLLPHHLHVDSHLLHFLLGIYCFFDSHHLFIERLPGLLNYIRAPVAIELVAVPALVIVAVVLVFFFL